jgi:hypothetical protein
MPLQFTAARSSRIRKPKPPSKKRPQGAPQPSLFSHHARSKTSQPQKGEEQSATFNDLDDEDRLADLGPVSSLTPDTRPWEDVTAAVTHILSVKFSSLPERAGMNSTRIAAVLNFQRSLPPIVSLSQVHAVVGSSTQTERQISAAVDAGVLRRIVVPVRGTGMAGVGEGLVLSRDWEDRVRGDANLEDDVKGMYVPLHYITGHYLPYLIPSLNQKVYTVYTVYVLTEHAERFLSTLRSNPKVTTLPGPVFYADDATALLHAGYLTSWSGNHASLHLDPTSKPDFLRISQAPSGSIAAVGGDSAIHASKGSGGGTTSRSIQRDATHHGALLLSLPNTGPHLRLLTAARAHLLALLGRSKYREAPLYLLRERWDGAVEVDTGSSRAKRARGETAGVLPGKTRKWKVLYGLSFEWVLGECLGAGLIEVFETGAVGRGVRAL